jgi:Zn-finger protein
MESSYKFYNNKGCHYLPCHKVNNVDEFNCMFCYCPLYFFDECGGNYKDKSGIKDCSDCLIPHSPKGYDYINQKIKGANQKRRELWNG